MPAVPGGPVLRACAALDGRDRRAPGGQARPHGQPHLRHAGKPAARTPRRRRLRDEDGRQAGEGLRRRTMAILPDMTKHRGFPGGMPGTGIQFTIRRANPKGVTPLKAIPRRARPAPRSIWWTPPSSTRSGTISAPSPSSAATSTPPASTSSSAARSSRPTRISTRSPTSHARHQRTRRPAELPGEF